MKGLIIKDLLMIKGNLKHILFLYILFFALTLQGSFDLSFILVMVSVMLFMSTFSYDEYNKWDAYAITLPNGRNNIVKSKYVSTIIIIVVSTLITLMLSIIVGFIKNNLDLEITISTMLGSCFALVVLVGVLYPIIFKFGIEKGRIILFVVAFAVAIIAKILFDNLSINIPVELLTFLENYFVLIISTLSIFIILVSYKISKLIYLKKEF